MSEATLFEYPYGVFLMERLEFILITQNELEAKIMRVIEYEMIKQKEDWQNRVARAVEEKKIPPKEPKEYWVRLSHSQIISKLFMFNTAKVGAKHPLSISEGTLRKAMSSLTDTKQFLLSRSKPGDEFGAPMYTLNRSTVQSAMKQLPENPFGIFLGLTSFEGGEVQNLKVGGSKFEGGEVDILNLGGTENVGGEVQNLKDFKDRENITLKDNEEESKSEQTDAPAFVASATLPPVVSAVTQTEPLPIATPTPEEIHDNKVTQGETNHDRDSTAYPVHSAGIGLLISQHLPVQETTPRVQTQIDSESSKPEPTVGNTAAVQVLPPLEQAALVELSPSYPQSGKGRGKPKPELSEEELALQARCTGWYDKITEWCGGPMTKGGQVMNERRVIKLACQKYTDAQLEAIFTYITTRDWKWSKIDNRFKVRCYVLWDEAGNVAQILKEERQGKKSPAPTQETRQAALSLVPARMPSREELRKAVY